MPSYTGSPESRRGRAAAGFTILELLVVIFIMLAMTGIAVAAFRKFLDIERIKLAGGQVVSSISLARQYAMSKRAKVMVELVEPKLSTAAAVNLTPVNLGFEAPVTATYVYNPGGGTWSFTGSSGISANNSGFTSGNPGAPEGSQVAFLQTTGAFSQDISGFQAGAGYTVTFFAAKRSSTGNHDFRVTLGSEDAGVYTTTVSGYSTFTTPEVKPGAGAKTLTFTGINSLGGDKTSFIDGVAIEMSSPPPEEDLTAEQEEKLGAMPRAVRITPYLRMLNSSTGGVTWLLDEDVNALRLTYLPAQVHYELLPSKAELYQYDPTYPPTYRTKVRKVWMDLWPDGSCTAAPPNLEGWTNRVNTVIIRDTVTGDVGLMFVPPASAFTRNRYLFGDEVNAFQAAHSLYSLW